MMTRVAIGLAMIGVGWHVRVTLLFNVLVTSSPQNYVLREVPNDGFQDWAAKRGL